MSLARGGELLLLDFMSVTELHQLSYSSLVKGNPERLSCWTVQSVGTHPRDLSMPSKFIGPKLMGPNKQVI